MVNSLKMRQKSTSSYLDAFSKALIVLIITLPFTMQYKSPVGVMSFGEFILVPFILFGLVKELKERKAKGVNFCGVYIYLTVVSATSLLLIAEPWFSFPSFATVLARIIYYSALIYISAPRFSLEYSMKWWVPLAIGFSTYLVIQWIVYNLQHIYLPIAFSNDLLFGSEQMVLQTDLERYYRFGFRPSSLFTEASYFAFFVAIPLMYLLHDGGNRENRTRIFEAAFITLALVLSTASSGLIVLLIAWASYFLGAFQLNKHKQLTFNPFAVLFVMLIVALVIAILFSPIGEYLLTRTQGGGSLGSRVIRGFVLYNSFGIPQKLMGVGINNLDSYMDMYGIFTAYDEVADLNYLSMFNSSFVFSGIPGLLALAYMFIRFWRTATERLSKTLTIWFFATAVYASIQFSGKFALIAIVLISLHEYERQRMHTSDNRSMKR